eukprot:TRINITY_DN1485_c0_g1_i18.p1 TRINITY_DN1485_c0_g1~~TRINITY_DN1485_c0_g1_i18.p1  ORF type:complete len:333 (+),score=47.54 TRINITY_DN1485_c0_g1_i18:74-1072(+)
MCIRDSPYHVAMRKCSFKKRVYNSNYANKQLNYRRLMKTIIRIDFEACYIYWLAENSDARTIKAKQVKSNNSTNSASMFESIVIKLEYHDAIKRTRKVPSSLTELRKLIFECFPELVSATITTKYRDKENDLISLSTEEDLQEAYLQLREEKQNALKLHIENIKEVQDYPVLDNSPAEENKGMAEINERMVNAAISEEPKIVQSTIENVAVNDEVACSGCLMAPIIGDTYKCTTCPNYNLCAACVASCVHPAHAMKKIQRPPNSRANHFSQFNPFSVGSSFLLSMLPFGGLESSFAGHGRCPRFTPGYEFWGGYRRGWGLSLIHICRCRRAI